MLRAASLLLCAIALVQPIRALDQPDKVIAACGKPQFDTHVLNLRQFHYPAGDVSFQLIDGQYIFHSVLWHGRSIDDFDQASRALPCLASVHFAAPDAVEGPVVQPALSASNGSDAPWGMIALVVFVGAVAVTVKIGNERAWRNRPQRLCTNCYTMAQPLQHKNKRWYCGRCGADNPAPLDSPLAQAWIAKQRAGDPVIQQYLK